MKVDSLELPAGLAATQLGPPLQNNCYCLFILYCWGGGLVNLVPEQAPSLSNRECFKTMEVMAIE